MPKSEIPISENTVIASILMGPRQMIRGRMVTQENELTQSEPVSDFRRF